MAKAIDKAKALQRAKKLKARIDALFAASKRSATRDIALAELARIAVAVEKHAPVPDDLGEMSQLRWRLKEPLKHAAQSVRAYFRNWADPIDADAIESVDPGGFLTRRFAEVGVKLDPASLKRLLASTPSEWLIKEFAKARGVSPATVRDFLYRQDRFEHALI